MNRRKFALSWGRKLFFGISWPLSSILGLLYFRSFILPESGTEFIYVLLTYLGQFGIFNTLVYFFLFAPVVLIFPTYYISRFWSLILILLLNLFIFLDAYSFSSYHHHIYSYIYKIILPSGFHHFIGASAGVILLSVATFVIAILIWIRGELLWRSMQARFSNPVGYWYLLLILVTLGLSKTMFHYGTIHPKLSDLFPINLNFKKTSLANTDNRKFFYPSGDLECRGKQNPNLVLIVLNEWDQTDFNLNEMPKVFHMRRHAHTFNSHVSNGLDTDTGLYSLMYSVPATYMDSTRKIRPAIFDVLKARKYEIVDFQNREKDSIVHDESLNLKINQWSETRAVDNFQPFFISMVIAQKSTSADREIQKILFQLLKHGLLKNTNILITGAYGGKKSNHTPLVWITPEPKGVEFNHPTSHFDLMPSVMEKLWGCRKSHKEASAGNSLLNPKREWFLISSKKDFKILDVKRNNLTTVKEGQISDIGDHPRHEFVFSAMKLMTKFYRP
jgi:membrane-anchored protein YejM (alkaline phosphatase superfamily)